MHCSGDAFLAVSGSAQIKVYDRDGIERGESLRGDMYIRDQRNTKGHVSPATGGQWNPTDKYEVSYDSCIAHILSQGVYWHLGLQTS